MGKKSSGIAMVVSPVARGLSECESGWRVGAGAFALWGFWSVLKVFLPELEKEDRYMAGATLLLILIGLFKYALGKFTGPESLTGCFGQSCVNPCLQSNVLFAPDNTIAPIDDCELEAASSNDGHDDDRAGLVH